MCRRSDGQRDRLGDGARFCLLQLSWVGNWELGEEGKVRMDSLGGVEAGGGEWERTIDPYNRHLFAHFFTHKPSHTHTDTHTHTPSSHEYTVAV